MLRLCARGVGGEFISDIDSNPQSKCSTEEVGDAKEDSHPECAYWLIVGDGDGSSDDRSVGPVIPQVAIRVRKSAIHPDNLRHIPSALAIRDASPRWRAFT